jgi:DNA-binding protein H-NS
VALRREAEEDLGPRTAQNSSTPQNFCKNQVDKRLLECRAELEKQLAAFPGPKSNSGKSSLKGKKVPPKYRSPSGETWAGRGARPKWLVAALKKGKKMESFLIQRR